MFPAAYKKRLATALAGAALASALAVSGAWAHYGYQATESPDVPPPPSSIAVSAAEEYQELRSPDAVDAAREAGDPPSVETPAQTGSYPVGEVYDKIRPPDTPVAANTQPVAAEPAEPSGFDLVSAAIGAVAAGALSLLLMATLGTRGPAGRRPASA
jgi:hypothetical protein